MADRLDIILFGATGFTGKHCIEVIYKLAKADNRSLIWGIAGRSESKLREILLQCSKKNLDVSSIPIIQADVKDYDSLINMTARAKVLINCSGPYRFFGEPVIKACIETGTHHVDISGEPQYMESIQLNYHQAAKEKGIYIVSACGFDSVPADLGVLYLQKNFQGTLNSVEMYVQMGDEGDSTPGASLNYGTWESAVYAVANASEMDKLQHKLYPTSLPNFMPKLEQKPSFYKSDLINKWVVPFMGSDRSVVLRTQRHFYDNEKLRPVQVHAYLGLNSFFYLILMFIFGTIFVFLAKYKFGRNLLLKYPTLFSGGILSNEEPTEQKLQKIKFSILFYGKGWSEKVSATQLECKTAPNKTIIGHVSGTNPGYGFTCTAVTLSAIVLLTETDKLPDRGGVYTPGAVFAKTTFFEQLQQNGLECKIISEQ